MNQKSLEGFTRNITAVVGHP